MSKKRCTKHHIWINLNGQTFVIFCRFAMKTCFEKGGKLGFSPHLMKDRIRTLPKKKIKNLMTGPAWPYWPSQMEIEREGISHSHFPPCSLCSLRCGPNGALARAVSLTSSRHCSSLLLSGSFSLSPIFFLYALFLSP